MPWDQQRSAALGARVREYRKAQGLTQETLAHAAGITKNQVQLIEAGRGSAATPDVPSNPRATTLHGLAEALGISMSDLLHEL